MTPKVSSSQIIRILTHTLSVPKYLSLENRVSLTDTFFERHTLKDGVVCVYNLYISRKIRWRENHLRARLV
jgi:hypothetical protein